MELQQTAQYLLQPLVSSGVFEDETTALKTIVYEFVSSKINTYQTSIDTFQEKYEMDFEQFTQHLEGKSTMETDDDWQEWEGAIEMKEAWEETLERIQH